VCIKVLDDKTPGNAGPKIVIRNAGSIKDVGGMVAAAVLVRGASFGFRWAERFFMGSRRPCL
jgi:hypothetical protein